MSFKNRHWYLYNKKPYFLIRDNDYVYFLSGNEREYPNETLTVDEVTNLYNNYDLAYIEPERHCFDGQNAFIYTGPYRRSAFDELYRPNDIVQIKSYESEYARRVYVISKPGNHNTVASPFELIPLNI